MLDPVAAPVTPVAPAAAPVAPAPVAPKPTAPAAAPAPAQKPAAAAPVAPAPTQAPAPGQVPLSALMEERDKRQALQTELEQLRAVQRGPQPVMGQAPQIQPPNIKEEMDKLWQNDPRAAVERTVMLAAQWQDNINAQVDGEAASLAGKYKDFNDYRDTAMRYVRALPLDQRARPGIVEMAYLVTRGQNVDQIIEAQRQAFQKQFLENPAAFQTPPGAGGLPPAPTGVQATEAQIRAAGAMHIPIEDYMKWVKK